MAIELATAYVSLTTSAKGLRGEIDKAVGGAVDSTGKKQGSRLGGLLWGGVKKVGLATGAGIAAVTGAALFKGFGRLSGIENAEAKLRGLGHSAETVEGIMDNALASVKGTAFGLDEAATTAAGAVAAGIKPGKELERVLGLTGDTATIAGTSMGEMGAIFNKVAAGNRLSMGEVNQLADRGVPIMQMLADQYGVTAVEARKMVERGEVDFAAFSTAIEDNIAGAALESGNTTEGAFKNMGAALGRVGASLLGGIFPKLKGGFGAITGALDNLGPTAERVGAAIGTAIQWAADKVGNFVTEFKNGEGAGGQFRDVMTQVKDALMAAFGYVRDTVIPALSNMWGWVRDNKDLILSLAAGLGIAFAALKTFMFIKNVTVAVKAFSAALAANPIGLVVTAIGLLIGGLIYLYNTNETARKIMDAAWAAIKTAISATVDWVMNTAWPWMRDAFQWIGDKATWLWKTILSPAFSGIKSAVSATVSWVKDTAWPWMKGAFQNIGDAAGTLKDRAKTAWEGITGAVSGAWDKVKGVLDKFKSGLSSLRDRFRTIKDGIASIWGSVVSAVAGPINSAVTFFNSFLGKLENAINKIPGVNISLPRIPAIPVPARAAHANDNLVADPGYADGGTVAGWSPHAKADNILARLTAGEFVLPVNATKRLMGKLGAGGLEMLRRGQLPAFANGGRVGSRMGGGWGDIWDAIKGAGSWIKDVLTDPVGAIKKLGKSLLGGIGDSWPAQILTGVGGDMLGKLGQWVKDKFFGGSEGGGVVPGGMPWQQIWGIVKMLNPGARFTSGQRGVGSRTASGAVSYHGMGRAVDFVSPNMAASWRRLANLPIPWTELYYTPSGFMRRGRIVPRSQVSGITQQNHYDHVHAAYGQGGLVKPLLFDRGGYLPTGTSLVHNATGAPEPLARVGGDAVIRLHRDDLEFLAGALSLQVDGRVLARANREGNHALGAPGRWGEARRLTGVSR